MSIVTCIILDGTHKGQTLTMPHQAVEYSINLYRPQTQVVCDCNENCDDGWELEQRIETYYAAFRSTDGNMILYSRTGKSDVFVENRDWILSPDRHAWAKPEPIIVGCRSDRATNYPPPEIAPTWFKEVAIAQHKRAASLAANLDNKEGK